MVRNSNSSNGKDASLKKNDDRIRHNRHQELDCCFGESEFLMHVLPNRSLHVTIEFHSLFSVLGYIAKWFMFLCFYRESRKKETEGTKANTNCSRIKNIKHWWNDWDIKYDKKIFAKLLCFCKKQKWIITFNFALLPSIFLQFVVIKFWLVLSTSLILRNIYSF